MRIFLAPANCCLAVALLVTTVWAGGSTGIRDGVLNAVFLFEDQAVQLIHGRAETKAAPWSAAKVVTWSLGNPVYGDLNGDGRDNAVLFLAQEFGGSGTFYYVAAAIATAIGWQGTHVFLGDRIAPKAIDISKRDVIAEYVDRRPDQPMSSAPSIRKTVFLEFRNGRLDVARDDWMFSYCSVFLKT